MPFSLFHNPRMDETPGEEAQHDPPLATAPTETAGANAEAQSFEIAQKIQELVNVLQIETRRHRTRLYLSLGVVILGIVLASFQASYLGTTALTFLALTSLFAPLTAALFLALPSRRQK